MGQIPRVRGKLRDLAENFARHSFYGLFEWFLALDNLYTTDNADNLSNKTGAISSPVGFGRDLC